MEKRVLGKTGEKLSIIGFGGIIVMNMSHSSASSIVAKAVDRGINYFDVAPSYGNSEEVLGPALKPYRDKVFLACKTEKRTRKEAAAALERSLKLLRTDYLDLYQLHAVDNLNDVEQVLGSGGAIEALLEAQEQDRVKYIGFTSHSEEAALALLDRFDFDTMLFPFNWVSWHQANFGPRVLEKAVEKGIGILAIKALAKRKWKPEERNKYAWPRWYATVESFEEASLALRFTLSLPVTSAVSPSRVELLWWACDIADNFKPLSEEEMRRIAELSRSLEPVFPQ
ncbi:MAG: aldo/keto reductase [Thermoproteota archaeon]|nr:aldo/keto reductase [Candidatus Brockarchaeota archaeon]